jgi:uncharacterized membrane protein YozB (DUF420 family)
MKLDEDSNFCIHCGKQLKDNNQIVEDEKKSAEQEKKHTKNIIILAISTFNLFVIVPISFYVAFFVMVFGFANNDKFMYQAVLIMWEIYCVLSVIFPILYLVKVLSKAAFADKKRGKIVGIVVTAIFLLVMAVLIFYLNKYF